MMALGEVTETCFANIAIKGNDERWITPPLTSGLLAGLWKLIPKLTKTGTKRRKLLEDNEIFEKAFTVQAMKEAAEIMLFNSVRGCWTPALQQ